MATPLELPTFVEALSAIILKQLEIAEDHIQPATPQGKAIASQLFTDTFWRAEAEHLFNILLPLFLKATKISIATGLAQLIDMIDLPGLEAQFGEDIIAPLASTYANQASFNVAWGVSQSSERYLQGAISSWIDSGAPLKELQAELSKYWAPYRAKAIATTEVTRVFAEANIMIWRESGYVEGKKWQTARDELVCPICRPLHEQTIELDGGFSNPVGGLGPTAPPAHVNCRCWIQPVIKMSNF